MAPVHSAGRPVSGTCSTVTLRRKVNGRSRPPAVKPPRPPVLTSMMPLMVTSLVPVRKGVSSKPVWMPWPFGSSSLRAPICWKVKPSASHSRPKEPFTISCSLPFSRIAPGMRSPT